MDNTTNGSIAGSNGPLKTVVSEEQTVPNRKSNTQKIIIITILLSVILLVPSISIYFFFPQLLMTFRFSSNSESKAEKENFENHYRGIDCSLLTGSDVRPGNDILELRRDICSAERAWFEDNPSFCKLHSDPAGCYSWMAIKTGDLSLCKIVNDENYNHIESELKESAKNDAWIYKCYNATARWRGDPSVCDLIPYKSSYEIESCKKTSNEYGKRYLEFKNSSPI